MVISTQSDRLGSFFAHHGVKGQKWGVRKDREPGGTQSGSGQGWNIDSDGRITIEKGATISRVVRGTAGLFGGAGHSLDEDRPVYAAFKPKDVNDYEHFFGRSKSLLVKNASTVLKLTPTTQLKAPGPKEATKIFFDIAKNDPAAKSELTSLINGSAKRTIDDAIKDPSSQKAYDLYTIALDSGNYSTKHGSVNTKYFAALKKSGYNMLLDPSDAAGGFDAPIIVLSGKTLSLKSQHIVDKVSQEKARKLYKTQRAEAGKSYLEKLGYNFS